MRRGRISNKRGRRVFSRTAGPASVHPKNAIAGPMRGGIRL